MTAALATLADPDLRGADHRWQPARAGVVNVWQYDEETLEFAAGRLLLFGANGSGKTMLLELLLPYLLDARGQPGRLSTSGADRGGLWERVTGYRAGEGRVGFLWVQHSRRTDDGRTEHFTCGTRLRAKPAGGGDHCWFTTTQRPGVDLHLLDEQRRPVPPETLGQRIGERGTVWGRDAGGYREAVRAALYPELSAGQLGSLIDALLVVRKQSVTDGLSAAVLDELLTAGLPGLDDTEVAKVARGFEDLDRRRDEITRMQADLRAVTRLGSAVRGYARAVLRREADGVTAAETRRDGVTRTERQSRAQRDDAQQAQQALEANDADLRQRHDDADARLAGLRRSEAYRAGDDLARLRDAAGRLEQAATDDEGRAASDGELRDTARAQAEHRAAAAADAAAQLTRAAAELRQAADQVGAGAPLEGVADASLPEVAEAALGARRQAVDAVRRALDAHQRAVAQRDDAAGVVEQADVALRVATAALEAAQRQFAEADTTWRAALRAWAADLVELDADALSGLDREETPADVTARVGAAHTATAEAMAALRQGLIGRKDELDEQREILAAERATLAAGTDPEPDAPRWRQRPADRAGAPLWALVDFAADLDERRRDGLEAGLLAAGLLDAWVWPDGRIEPPADADVVAGASTDTAPPTGRSLAEALTAEADAPVPAAAVAGVLAGVGCVERDAHRATDTVVVALDGSFKVGAVTGRGPREPAAHIGATARRAARERRIAAIDVELAEVAARREQLTGELQRLATRRTALDGERDRLPPATAVIEARARTDRSDARVEEATRSLGVAEQRLTAAEATARSRLADLLRAANHAVPTLPTEQAGLAAVEDGLRVAAEGVHTCRIRVGRAADATERAEEAAAEAEQRTAAAEVSDERARGSRRQARSAAVEHAQLEEAVGTDVRAVQRQVAAAERQLRATAEDRERTQGRLREAAAALATAETTLVRAVADREAEDARRAAAHARFAAAVDDGLATDADVEVAGGLDGLTAVLAAARGVRDALDQVVTATDAVARLRQRAGEALHAATQQLAGRADLALEPSPDHDWERLLARVDGLAHRAPSLTGAFTESLRAAQAELTASEQDVFEQTLTGSVRAHLAGRIRSAQQLVDAMNHLLAQIRTAAGGVRVELGWDVDGDVDDRAGLRRVRTLLLGDVHDDDERAELHDFLRRQIERVRASDADTGSWQDRLTTVLDYRTWHRFTVLVHHDRFGDRPLPLGSRRVSLSAGEKTVALTLPLLAAVAAHYLPRDGVPLGCPRLLLMDELFPKVDRANKRQLLGLLPKLDLDAVFTSDKDWCDYDTLDRIAIHVVQKDGDQSLTTRFTWDGSQRLPAPVDDDGVAAAARAPLQLLADDGD